MLCLDISVPLVNAFSIFISNGDIIYISRHINHCVHLYGVRTGSAPYLHSVCTVSICMGYISITMSICMGSAQGPYPVYTVSALCPFVWGLHRVRTVSALCPFVWGPHRVRTLSAQCLHSVRTVSNCIRWINSNDYLEQLHHSLNFV